MENVQSVIKYAWLRNTALEGTPAIYTLHQPFTQTTPSIIFYAYLDWLPDINLDTDTHTQLQIIYTDYTQ